MTSVVSSTWASFTLLAFICFYLFEARLRDSCGRQMPLISRDRLRSLMQSEQKRFIDERPKSKALFERARKSLLGGVPMNWMSKWAGAFPPFVGEAHGAEFLDVDGHRYIDFCLGDTGAMTGHSPSATVAAVQQQVARGITLMLPSEDAVWVGEELRRRFGLPTGNLLSLPPMPTASRSASPARSPAVQRFWFSTGAITAVWTKPSSLWRTACPKCAAET